MRDSTGTRVLAPLALLAIFASSAPFARAEDPPPSPPPPAPPAPAPKDRGPVPPPEPGPEVFDNLPDITVTAPTLSERPLFETTVPVNAITAERMAREQPRVFSDVLRDQPGLWQTQGSAGQAGTPVIRGTMGNQVLLLLDGVRLSHSLFTIGPGQDWDALDLEPVSRIEVVRSPDAVLYGTQGIGGATALYSAFPSEFACEGVVSGVHTHVLGAAGGENLWLGRVEGFAATPRVRAVGGITRIDAGDLEAGGDVGRLHPTAWGTWAGDLRAEVQASPRDVVGFAFYAAEKAWPDRFTNPGRDYDNWINREVGLLRWRRETCDAWADDVEVRIADVHHQRLYFRHDKFNRDEFEVWVPQADVVAHKGVNGCNLLTYGAHVHEEAITASVRTSGGLVKSIPDGTLVTGGVYAQDEWTPNPRWRVTGGLRVDGVRVQTHPDAATTDPLVNPDDIRVDRSDWAWTGKLSAYHRATDAVALTANLARGFRFPGPPDLAQFRQVPDEIQVGNPDLKPEYSTVFDLGVHVRQPCWRASVTGFVERLDDLIIGRPGVFNGNTWADRNGNLIQDPDEDFSIRQNAGSARFYGVEADGEWTFRPGWTAFGNFTWWKGDVSPDPTEPIGVPTNGTLGLRYAPTECWWAEASAHMVAKFSDIPAEFYAAEQFFWKDPQDEASGPLRNDHSIPGYTTVDLRGGVRLSDRLSLTAGIENLLDKAYRPFGSRHDGPGRTFLLSLTVDL